MNLLRVKKPKRGSSRPVSVRMATDALTMASRKTASEYREKHLDDLEKAKAAPYKYYFDVEKSEEIMSLSTT